MVRIRGRAIKAGRGEGTALVSEEPIGFLGGVDPETGIVIEKGHPLQGQAVCGRVLVFPTGKGSTVGSYTLYRLARNGLAPAAIVNQESEAIVAVGAIISGVPMVDQVDIAQIQTGDHVVVEDGVVIVGHADLDQARWLDHYGQAAGSYASPGDHRPSGSGDPSRRTDVS